MFKRVAGAAGAGLLLVILALSAGSVSVGFLKERIAAAVRQNLPADTGFTVSDIRASLGFGTIIVDLRDLGLTVPDRADIGAASLRTHVGLLPLLAGRVRPAEVDADGVTVALMQPISAARPTGSRISHARSLTASLNEALNNTVHSLGKRGLARIAMTDIRIDGEALAHSPLAANLPLQVRKLDWTIGEDGSDLTVDFDSDQGRWTLHSQSGTMAGDRNFTDLAVSGFPPSFLLARLTDPTRRPNYDAVADLGGRIVTEADGAFQTAAIRLTLGPGHLALMQNDRTPIDGIAVAVELPPEGNVLTMVEGSVRSGGNQVAVTAELDPGDFGGPMLFEGKLGRSRLPGLGDNDAPVDLDAGYARAVIDPAAGRITLDRAFVSGPEGAASLSGEFAASGDDAGLSGVLQVEETTAGMVHALWPPIVARQARNWFQENIKTGLVGPGQLRVTLPIKQLGPQGRDLVLPADSLIGEIPFRFAMFSPTPQFPQAQRSSGFVRFANATLMVSLGQAEIATAGYGTADVHQTYFRIPNLGRPGAVGYLDLRLAGPVPVLAQLSNSGPLSIAEDRGLSPKDLSGEGRLELFAEIPLGERIAREDIHAEFKLDLSGFSSSTPLGAGRMVSDANLIVSGTIDNHRISGDAVIDGIPARIDISSGTTDVSSTVRLTLEEEAQRQLGIDLGPYLNGPIIAMVDPAADNLKTVELDLTPADIDLPFLGWHKLPGVPAHFKARLERSENGTEFSLIRLSGEGFEAAGQVSIGRDGNLVALEARSIKLRPDEDFSISVKRNGDRLQALVTGEAVDVRGMISALQQPAEPAETDPLAIDIAVKVGRLIGHNGIEIADVDGTATYAGGQVDSLSVRAGPDDMHTIELAVEPETQTRKLSARFGNAGDILRFLNVYRSAYGGGMAMEFGGPADTQDGSGHVSIAGFRVRESGRTIAVSRLSIPFSRKDQSISIYKAAMVADGLDATAKGGINLESRYMSIRGTVVPTNGLNRLPASVPILGDLLGARKRKGLIGIAFTLAGPLSSPELKFNVASAVTPGIVRRLFGK